MASGGGDKDKEGLESKIDKILQMFCLMDDRFKKMEERSKKMESSFDSLLTEMQSLKSESKQQGQRVQIIEKDLKELTKKSDEKMREHNYRITNLEDRQRRRNLRFRGFKTAFSEGKSLLEAFIQWVKSLEIQIEKEEVERIHWLFPRKGFQMQRDFIVAFASERRAEEMYKKIRSLPSLKYEGTQIRILRDLSRQTLGERAILRPITNLLFRNNIKFSWGFPNLIIIYKDQEILKARSLDEGWRLLQKLGIQAPEEATTSKIAPQFVVETEASDSSGRETPETIASIQIPADLDDIELSKLESQVKALRRKARQERAKRRDIRD